MSRRLLTCLALLAAALLFADGAAPYQPANMPKTPVLLSQTTDFLDNAFFFQGDGDYYTKEELRERIQLAYDHGFRKIYFRGTGGVSYYPSKVRGPYRGGHPQRWVDRLVKTIESYDTLPEFVKVCHELGMQVFYWDPIFDNTLLQRNFPGMPEYEKFGDFTVGDPNLKEQFYWEHRKAYLPPQEFAKPVATIRMRVYTKFENPLTEKDLLIYTAPHGKPFAPYTKPFKVKSVTDANGSTITISGLDITDPVLKFALPSHRASISTTHDAIWAYYADGTDSGLKASLEIPYGKDRDRIHVLAGSTRCDDDTWGTADENQDTTLIARFGDVPHYAHGLPEFGYREPRERLKAIVSELYERYPTLDGVSFSIRSHSQPPTGTYEALGYGRHFFGFGQPVVDEYKRLYGTDPRKEPYDEHKLLKVRGQFLTETLGEIAEIVHAHGGKLQMMAPISTKAFEGTVPPGLWRFAHGATFLWWRNYDIDDFFDITTWAKKGYVDTVIMLGTGYRQVAWSEKWDAEIARFRKHLEGTNTKLAIHHEVCDRGDITKVLNQFLPLLLKADIDEIEFYEENAMYLYDPEAQDYAAMDKILSETPRAVVKEVEYRK